MLLRYAIIILFSWFGNSQPDDGVVLKYLTCDCKDGSKLACKVNLSSPTECGCLYDTFHYLNHYCYAKSEWKTRTCEYCDHRRFCNRTNQGQDGQFTCECAGIEKFCVQRL